MIPPVHLRSALDPAWPAERSVALRYAPAMLSEHLWQEDLLACTQAEGVRLVELGSYGGVRLVVMDETTRMHTGTYKSLTGCVATALCRRAGYQRVVFSSGANTGSALTDYGARAGLETFFFCPSSTLHKLEPRRFERGGAHLVAVEGNDRRVKAAARLFAEAAGLPLIPPLSWRLLSAGCRGLFLAEQILVHGLECSWFVQALCAGYGPIGLYRVLRALAEAGQLPASRAPKLLGIQQAGLCPVVQAWAERRASLPDVPTPHGPAKLIEPTLYNVHPDQTYPMLCEILHRFGGDIQAVSPDQFDRYAPAFAQRLEQAGIVLATTSVGGRTQVLEKAGLLAGAGTLKAIDRGLIRPTQTAVCALTGGAGPAPSRPPRPERRIAADEVLEKVIAELTRAFGLGGAAVEATSGRGGSPCG